MKLETNWGSQGLWQSRGSDERKGGDGEDFGGEGWGEAVFLGPREGAEGPMLFLTLVPAGALQLHLTALSR